MSASREKRARQGQKSAGEQGSAGRGKTLLYAALGVAAAALTIALVVWNTGFFQGRAVAATVNGQTYSVPYLQYYYNMVRNETAYYASYGLLNYDNSKSPKQQVYDPESGQTYHEYFIQSAMDDLTLAAAQSQEATAQGYTLSAEAQAQRAETLNTLRTEAVTSGYGNAGAYLRAVYGNYVTLQVFEGILDMELTAGYYAQDYALALEYAEADLDSYYRENRDNMDLYTFTSYAFRGEAPADEGLTQEEKDLGLAQSQAQAQADAQRVRDALAAGEDVEALPEAERVYTSVVEEEYDGASLGSDYADWLKDAARQEGDVTLLPSEDGNTHYALRFESRRQDADLSADVRHALVAAETDAGATEPTEAQYEAARARAEQLLAQWQAGGGSEDAFAALAQTESADPSSAAQGGLMEGVNRNSGFVDTFTDWALDPARRAGDSGIVQNTGSSVKGWHLMYFRNWGAPNWKLTAENALRNQDFAAWRDALVAAAQVSMGSGTAYLG